MAKRTVLRSSTGKKLYAVRAADGTFKDIQSYARAHAADLRKTATATDAGSPAAAMKAAKKATKKAGKKVAKKSAKKTVKKSAKKAARR